MRFGVVLREPLGESAVEAEELGFDLAWLDERITPAPLVAAGWLAAVTTWIRIVASVAAGAHPVALAEEAAVADLATGGRLVLCVGSDDETLLGETVEILLAALAARPFVHDGPRWRVPARLPEHEHAEARVRVTPAPAQLELPVWVTGTAGRVVSAACGVPFVTGEEAGPAVGRVRPALRSLPQGAPEALVADLRAAREAWGLDTIVLDPGGAGRPDDLRAVAAQVRPLLQLDRLPPGLVRHLSELHRR